MLGSSNDVENWVQPTQKKHVLVGERLESDLGEPVDWVVKGIWPTDDLAQRVDRWMDESRPDVVYINTGSYWFLYRSVPLRVKRLLGRVGGERLGNAGASVAKSERWAHNAVFRGLRKVLQETIGGDTHFTTQQVIDRVSASVRVAAQDERTVVVVKGPHGKRRLSAREKNFQRDERERLKLHSALEALCVQLHVTYDGVGEGGVRQTAPYKRNPKTGDRMHADATLHEHEADTLYNAIHRGLIDAGRVTPPAEAPNASRN